MLGHLLSKSLVVGWFPAPGEAGGSGGGAASPVLRPQAPRGHVSVVRRTGGEERAPRRAGTLWGQGPRAPMG